MQSAARAGAAVARRIEILFAGGAGVRTIHIVLTLAAAAFLAARLHGLGLTGVIDALPRSAVFYALFAAAYFASPVTDWLIYRFAFSFHDVGLQVFLRKRVLNEALLDYAGEAYLYAQIRARTGIAATVTASAIKDVALLSGAVSNGATVLLLALLALESPRTFLDIHGIRASLGVAAVLVVGLLAALIVFRRTLLTADRRTTWVLLAAHTARLMLVLALQVSQWMAGLPGIVLSRWLTVLALWMVATRIPFVPNRDLMLAAAGAALAGILAAPPTAVAALFLAAGALPLMTHGLVLLVLAVLPQSQSVSNRPGG
jgi:hypothetical protein